MSPAVNCVVDRYVLNGDTYKDFVEIGLSVFAPLCGRNRGAFVMTPSDGHTYGCAAFPTDFASRAGVNSTKIVDSNSIDGAFKNGTISGTDAVDLVDLYVQSVYASSGAGVAQDVHACDVNGLTTLVCDQPKGLAKIRAVTLAGVLSPALWATGGKELTLHQARHFYTDRDFEAMNELGLNAVQIPVSLSVFDDDDKVELLQQLLDMAHAQDLGAVVQLVVPNKDTTNKDRFAKIDPTQPDATVTAVGQAAQLAASNRHVLGLILPSPALIAAARAESTTLPLLIQAGEADLSHFPSYDADANIFVALERDHLTSVADIASSDSPGDRLKMYYHETLACQGRAPIEYAACYKQLPAYVFHGFNLAIDDCIDQEASHFRDYGQCGRLDEQVDSDWWYRHRQSYAARQLAVFETGIGWTFDAWKLYKEDSNDKKLGVMDEYAKLLALENVAAAGLFPSLKKRSPAKLACLNNPVADFVLGDETLAPTPGPPPDCGNGWWNFTTEQCDYWIPPPEPTPCPTMAPLPVCKGGFWSEELGKCDTCPLAPLPPAAIATYSALGVLIALALGALFYKCCCGRRREEGYTQVPNASMDV